MAKNKIKRRKLSKEILEKRKQFAKKDSPAMKMLKKKIPDREERIYYLESAIAEFDRLLAI